MDLICTGLAVACVVRVLSGSNSQPGSGNHRDPSSDVSCEMSLYAHGAIGICSVEGRGSRQAFKLPLTWEIKVRLLRTTSGIPGTILSGLAFREPQKSHPFEHAFFPSTPTTCAYALLPASVVELSAEAVRRSTKPLHP